MTPIETAEPRVRSERLARCFLLLLAVLLTGYALLGRGFAYLGVPPVYVGEVGLLLALLVLFAHILVPIWQSRLVWLLLAFMGWGAANTFPYIPAHGMDALRDGAQWGYALFAIAVATALLKTGRLDAIVPAYARFARLFLLFVVPSFLLYSLAGDILPRLPWGPGGGVAVINPKGGDIAVHLAGIMVLMALGLARQRLNGWLWFGLWMTAAGLVAIVGRASFVTLALPFLALMLLRPTSGWHRTMVVVFAGIAALAVFDIEFDIGRSGRPISVDTLLLGVASIFGGTDIETFSGTKLWRLLWWETIVDYTVFGEHFWTGKGFGINLADADGFQVFWDRSLRSPHNGHLTLLARAGVPGLVLWILLQGSFAWSLFRAHWRDRLAGRREWADLSLWVLLYWLAFMVNATFDVFLEGPHGGIWFWSVFGIGLAHLIRRKYLLMQSQQAIP
jgi:hypothetical protein